ARIIDGIEHADSRQPQVLQGIGIELERAIVELGRIESNRAHPLRIDLMDLDRRIELHAEVAGLDLERNFIAMPQEMLAPLLNLLVLSEVQRAQGFGRRGGWGNIALGSDRASTLDHIEIAESLSGRRHDSRS